MPPCDTVTRFRVAVATRTIKMITPDLTDAELRRAYQHFDPESHRRQLTELQDGRRRDELALAARVQLAQPLIERRLPPLLTVVILWIGAVAGFLTFRHIR